MDADAERINGIAELQIFNVKIFSAIAVSEGIYNLQRTEERMLNLSEKVLIKLELFLLLFFGAIS